MRVSGLEDRARKPYQASRSQELIQATRHEDLGAPSTWVSQVLGLGFWSHYGRRAHAHATTSSSQAPAPCPAPARAPCDG